MMARLPLGTIRLLLAAVLSVSVSGAVLSGRTLAGFTAETINPNNIFETGTLSLFSTSNGQGVFTIDASNGGLVPGAIFQGQVTLRNSGTIVADRLKFYVDGAGVQNSPSGTCNESNTVAAVAAGCGLGRLANALELMLYYPVPDDATGTRFMCAYPAPAAGQTMVTVGSLADLVDPARGGCGFGPLMDPLNQAPAASGDETAPVDASAHIAPALKTSGALVPGYNTASGVQRPGECFQAATTTGGPCPRSLWMAGEERTLTIAVRLRDGAADNDYQGAGASFNIRWQAESGLGQ